MGFACGAGDRNVLLQLTKLVVPQQVQPPEEYLE